MTSQTRVILDPKRVSEHVFPRFDFISRLDPADVINTPVILITVWSGVDANPMAMWDASFTLTPPGLAQPGITGGLAGVIYLIKVTVSAGAKLLVLEGLMAVLPEGM